MSLRHDPPCFGEYYKEQLHVFEWVNDHRNDDQFKGVDWANGVGIAGHSMGGQVSGRWCWWLCGAM